MSLQMEHGAELLGLDSRGVRAACRAVDREIEAGTMPGAVLAVVHRGREWIYAKGDADPDPKRPVPVRKDTRFDSASLTKVVALLPLVLTLIDEGILTLSTPVSSWLPQFGVPGKDELTVGQLLTHTSGLQADMDLHSHGWSRDQMWNAVMDAPLQRKPGMEAIYSDIGYLVLGRLVEKALGIPLDEAARTRVFEPLGMKDAVFSPLLISREYIAATEYDSLHDGHLCGVVHDEKARALGGVCGHAGLFVTADDLIRYAKMWMAGGIVPEDSPDALNGKDPRRVLSKAAVEASTRSHTVGIPGAYRGLGWVLKGDRMDASGDWMSGRSYGHTGFTGTSLWIDPEHEMAVILLTNRVYGGRNTSVSQLRIQVHNALIAAVSGEQAI
ncbi:serine hydrolase domain-containing protein [Paenibacillus sp. DMB20]|uniref:serine hydrolase domain-containing protein n=1 Tax=Paenibacillus sp. DMB20 TaxID=1642570 RepID=UPI000627BC64|nr:serine hydrolase domain-containing protein [Paenibacillus sp. DMB20]KKO55074.1 beta-lactamase [Paenibacillus sp. DMB20]